MYATIQKWGNSQGLRIPKALLDAVGLKEHDRVELVQMDDLFQLLIQFVRACKIRWT